MYALAMRTTIEIDDVHRAELLRLAAQRREKGFSGLVREALDLYIKHNRAREEAIEKALEVKGSFSDAEATKLEESIRKVRSVWR